MLIWCVPNNKKLNYICASVSRAFVGRRQILVDSSVLPTILHLNISNQVDSHCLSVVRACMRLSKHSELSSSAYFWFQGKSLQAECICSVWPQFDVSFNVRFSLRSL